MSLPEMLLWRLLRLGRRELRFRKQHPIGNMRVVVNETWVETEHGVNINAVEGAAPCLRENQQDGVIAFVKCSCAYKELSDTHRFELPRLCWGDMEQRAPVPERNLQGRRRLRRPPCIQQRNREESAERRNSNPGLAG